MPKILDQLDTWSNSSTAVKQSFGTEKISCLMQISINACYIIMIHECLDLKSLQGWEQKSPTKGTDKPTQERGGI